MTVSQRITPFGALSGALARFTANALLTAFAAAFLPLPALAQPLPPIIVDSATLRIESMSASANFFGNFGNGGPTSKAQIVLSYNKLVVARFPVVIAKTTQRTFGLSLRLPSETIEVPIAGLDGFSAWDALGDYRGAERGYSIPFCLAPECSRMSVGTDTTAVRNVANIAFNWTAQNDGIGFSMSDILMKVTPDARFENIPLANWHRRIIFQPPVPNTPPPIFFYGADFECVAPKPTFAAAPWIRFAYDTDRGVTMATYNLPGILNLDYTEEPVIARGSDQTLNGIPRGIQVTNSDPRARPGAFTMELDLSGMRLVHPPGPGIGALFDGITAHAHIQQHSNVKPIELPQMNCRALPGMLPINPAVWNLLNSSQFIYR